MILSNTLSLRTSFLEVQKLYWDDQVTSLVGNSFPRDLGRFRYYPKGTNQEVYYTEILSKIHSKEDAFVSFYSDDEKLDGTVNRIFIDADEIKLPNGELKKVEWKDLKLFIYTFWNSLRVFYSGKKGFHIYLYINPVKIEELHAHKSRLYSVISTWIQHPIDARTWLDMSRMCRIPLTRHRTDPYKYKVPLHYNLTTEQIMEMAEHPESYTDLFYHLAKKKITPLPYQIFLLEPIEFLGL